MELCRKLAMLLPVRLQVRGKHANGHGSVLLHRDPSVQTGHAVPTVRAVYQGLQPVSAEGSGACAAVLLLQNPGVRPWQGLPVVLHLRQGLRPVPASEEVDIPAIRSRKARYWLHVSVPLAKGCRLMWNRLF